MNNDLLNNIDVKRVISPVSVADTTAQVGQSSTARVRLRHVPDRHRQHRDADATFTVLLEESDASGSGFAAVADADLLGTEALAGFQFDDDNECRKLGYIGSKRYTRLTITLVNNASAALLSAICVLGSQAGADREPAGLMAWFEATAAGPRHLQRPAASVFANRTPAPKRATMPLIRYVGDQPRDESSVTAKCSALVAGRNEAPGVWCKSQCAAVCAARGGAGDGRGWRYGPTAHRRPGAGVQALWQARMRRATISVMGRAVNALCDSVPDYGPLPHSTPRDRQPAGTAAWCAWIQPHRVSSMNAKHRPTSPLEGGSWICSGHGPAGRNSISCRRSASGVLPATIRVLRAAA